MIKKVLAHRHAGVMSALSATLLFGVSAPLAKVLLAASSPWLLAALLYLGSGVGLWFVRRLQHVPPVTLAWHDWGWLAGAILTGGIVAPVFLMRGLAGISASQSSLHSQCGECADRRAGVGRVQGKRGPTHRLGHDRHCGRRPGAELAWLGG